MAVNLWLGLLLTLIAGLFSGNCMLPMKFAKRWPWENTWLIFTMMSLLVLPWALAFVLVNDVGAVYAALPLSAFAAPFGFGVGWGFAQLLFGLSVARLGLALGYAIIVGLGALLGTLVPLFVKNREVFGTGRGALILSGVAIMMMGLTVSARAGKAREGSGVRTEGGSYAAALAVSGLAGCIPPMCNFA